MNPLLQQFITEARDLLEEAANGLLALESHPNDMDGVNLVFRAAHTLKGSTGLFDVLPMTHIVHAAEDILDAVKAGQVSVDSDLIDMLLDAFDQVGLWIDELEHDEQLSSNATHTGKVLSGKLRAWLAQARVGLDADEESVSFVNQAITQAETHADMQQTVDVSPAQNAIAWLSCLPSSVRLQAYEQGMSGHKVVAIAYTPEPECYFKGEDPFGLILQIPGLLGLSADTARSVKVDAELDVYQANIQLYAVATAGVGDIEHLFRYVSEQVMIEVPSPEQWLIPHGEQDDDAILLDISEQIQRDIEAQDITSLVTSISVAKDIVRAGSWAASIFDLMSLVINTAGNHKLAWLHVLTDALIQGKTPDWLAVQQMAQPIAQDGLNAIHDLDEVDRESLSVIMGLQAKILRLPIAHELCLGRIASIGKVIENVLHRFGHDVLLAQWLAVVTKSKISNSSEGMLAWLEQGTLALAEPATLSSKTTEQSLALNRDAALALIDIQRQVLMQSQPEELIFLGRLASVKTVLTSVLSLMGHKTLLLPLSAAVEASVQSVSVSELLAFIGQLNLAAPTVVAPAHHTNTALADVQHSGDPALLAAQTSTKVSAEPVEGTTAVGEGIAKTLRVEQASIDKLGDLIGELVVAKNAMPYLAQRAEREFLVPELAKLLKEQFNVVDRLTQELQSTIMKVQMLPVSQIFQRFPRLVRDISRKLGKKINLVIEGEETQADKTVIEVMSDPMIHLVRNSLDHGLEPPEERLAAGKLETGMIKLRAFQESDNVIIEIQDDGRGINPIRVKNKAIEKGLITLEQAESMSDQEAIYLIFQPNFSTNDEVTDLSGRGVGMDVVRSTIERIGGTLRVHSEIGKGTIIRLSLPLSMAISHVMEIEVANQVFGVPMDLVVETARLTPDRIKTIKQRETFIWRSRLVPLVRLRQIMQLPAGGSRAGGIESVLVVRREGSLIGLVVDDFRSKSEVIMKPLEGPLAGIPIYAGFALLGDGSVMLVLNIGGVHS